MVVKMPVLSFCREAECGFQSETSTTSKVLKAIATTTLTLAAVSGRAAVAVPVALVGGAAFLFGTSPSKHPTQASKAKEVDEAFKRQFVAHVTKKKQLIIDSTSANCSNQVEQ
jgi:hypothetical protein